jgi:hypothetical protein
MCVSSSIPRRYLLVVSRREALATLVATALQNKTTGFGAHTNSEAVRLGATAVVGLEGSLHCPYFAPEGNRKSCSLPIGRSLVKHHAVEVLL